MPAQEEYQLPVRVPPEQAALVTGETPAINFFVQEDGAAAVPVQSTGNTQVLVPDIWA